MSVIEITFDCERREDEHHRSANRWICRLKAVGLTLKARVGS
jgi:hypothetical protein